jgi:hypothetical protein
MSVNPLNAELNPICHFLALLGARHILHVRGVRVNIKINILRCTVNKISKFMTRNILTKGGFGVFRGGGRRGGVYLRKTSGRTSETERQNIRVNLIPYFLTERDESKTARSKASATRTCFVLTR